MWGTDKFCGKILVCKFRLKVILPPSPQQVATREAEPRGEAAAAARWNSVDQTVFGWTNCWQRHSLHWVNVMLWCCKRMFHSFVVLIEIKPLWKCNNSLCWVFGFNITYHLKSLIISRWRVEGEKILLNNQISLYSLGYVLFLSQWAGDTKVIYFYAPVLISSPLCLWMLSVNLHHLSALSRVMEKKSIGSQRHRGANVFQGSFRVCEPEDVHLWVTRRKTSKGSQLFWGAAVGDQTHIFIRSLVQGSDWILTQLGCMLMTTGGDWRSQKDPT